MKTTTILEELEITSTEMTQFDTIIDEAMKYSRKVQKRREQGIQKREDYLEKQKEEREDKLWQLEQAVKRYPNASQRELAKYLGWSVGSVNNYIKRL